MIRLALLLLLPLLATQDAKPQTVKQAVLGVETRSPTKQELKDFELPLQVRAEGQVVTAVVKKSAAEKAGIKKGDVILKLNENRFHSADSLRDFIQVTPPKTKIKVTLKRAESFKQEEIEVTLGSREVKPSGVAWQYAGIAQLDSAIKQAKKEEKLVLVGLSGAET